MNLHTYIHTKPADTIPVFHRIVRGNYCKINRGRLSHSVKFYHTVWLVVYNLSFLTLVYVVIHHQNLQSVIKRINAALPGFGICKRGDRPSVPFSEETFETFDLLLHSNTWNTHESLSSGSFAKKVWIHYYWLFSVIASNGIDSLFRNTESLFQLNANSSKFRTLVFKIWRVALFSIMGTKTQHSWKIVH